MKLYLCCGEPHFEWYEWSDVAIDTDEYNSFSLDYRGSWHLIGNKYNKEIEKWEHKELSKCEASYTSLVKFLAKIDKPISEIHNTHCYTDFTKNALNLLNDIEVEKLNVGE